MQTKPPAAYWAAWAAVLALIGLAYYSFYERLVLAWGPWTFSDAHTPHRVVAMVLGAAVYALLIFVALTRWEQIMAPVTRLIRFLRDVWGELQRVVWPSHEETYGFTVVVIVAVVVVALWVGTIDAILISITQAAGLFR
jgi:preprotein translocase SecE subunit